MRLAYLLLGFMMGGQVMASQAYFAGGCFWCTEHDFQSLEGVIAVTSGYMGGHVDNPTYEEVSKGSTGHYEIVEVEFDSALISYQKLLDRFWRMHDPSDAGGSFCDRGQQYSSAIFYTDEMQKKLSKGSIQALNDSKKFEMSIATKVIPASTFYPAEDYHQDYSERNPLRYKFYRYSCGRDSVLNETWQGDDTVYQLPELIDGEG